MSIPDCGTFQLGQERRYRLGGDILDSRGQMMACAFDELQPGVRQGTDQLEGGTDGH
jgi:hypothetical protein